MKSGLRWTLTVAASLTVTVAAFVPILFGLAETPLHDGDELPGVLLLSASGLASGGAGVLAAWLLHRRLRRTKPTKHPTPAA